MSKVEEQNRQNCVYFVVMINSFSLSAAAQVNHPHGPVCAFFHNYGLWLRVCVCEGVCKQSDKYLFVIFYLLDHLDDSHVQNTEVGRVEQDKVSEFRSTSGGQ